MNTPAVKTCPRCKKDKELSEFHKDQVDKPKGVCKACVSLAWKARTTRDRLDKYRARAKKFDDNNIQRYLLRYARRRAKEKGIECTIRPDDIRLRERCPILGTPLVKNTGQWSGNSYSLDRRDSSRGYVPGNVEVISWKANSLKSDLSLEQVKRLVQYMEGTLPLE